MKKKRMFRITVKARNADIVFEEGLEPGVLGFKEFIFDLEEKEFESPLFVKTLMDLRTALLDELLCTEVSEG